MRTQTKSKSLLTATLPAVLVTMATLTASHSWNGYHWARTSNPFTLKVGDNVDTNWDAFLDVAIADWGASSVLNLTEVPGGTTSRSCRPTSGRI